MKNTAIKKACRIIGVTNAADLLTKTLCDQSKGQKITRQTVYKYLKLGYAPSDWHPILTSATMHKVSRDEFDRDVLKHKRKCNPADVKKQVDKFLRDSSKSLQRVGKSRLKDKGVA